MQSGFAKLVKASSSGFFPLVMKEMNPIALFSVKLTTGKAKNKLRNEQMNN